MKNKHPEGDKNFDQLAARFNKNIYKTLKGQLRLAVLQKDFAEFVPEDTPLSVLDVGAGQGQWAGTMLGAGHSVVLADVSAEMLAAARENVSALALTEDQFHSAEFIQSSLQDLDQHLAGRQFDMVVCHAVLEWLNEPERAIALLKKYLKPSGWLSLIVYNCNGLIMKNLLRTNFKKVLAQDYRGYRGSLTPSNPLEPDQVRQWLKNEGFKEVCYSGIRTFHDYILNKNDRERDTQNLTELELQFSRVSPYRELGRYVHLLYRL